MATVDDVRQNLAAHTSAIDTLHQKLAALPGIDKERLAQAVGKYKVAAAAFVDDALGCAN
jgi:hypothetical protein